MIPLQFLIILFAGFAVFRAWRAWRAEVLDRRKFLLWLLFWTAVVIVILLPQTTSVLASFLGVGRGVDLILYLSVLALFYMIFQTSRKVDRLEKSLTELVRKLALKDNHVRDKTKDK